MMNDITMMVMTDDRKKVCGTIESAQNLVRFRSIKWLFKYRFFSWAIDARNAKIPLTRSPED